MTGPANGGIERGTRAPTRLTGTQGAVGAVLVVLVLGLVLRLIIARLLPGSGFEVDLGAFRYLGVESRQRGPERLLRPGLLPRLHAGLPLRPVDRRHRRQRGRGHRRPDQGPADPVRPRRRLARLVDGPRARRARPAGSRCGCGRRPQPDHLVRQRRVGPGRLVRRRLPAARPARAVARSPGTGRHLYGHRRDHQAPARHPDPDRGGRHDPTRTVAVRRIRRPGANRATDPHPHDRAWPAS